MRKNCCLSGLLIIISLAGFQDAFARPHPAKTALARVAPAKSFWRTEIYCGTDKNDGTQVTDEEWEKFLAEEVTPRFPDGFTVLEGYGQYRLAEGKIVHEKSRVLILLYPLRTRKSSHRKIEHLRHAYKKLFQQQSVLRVDFSPPVRVRF